MSVVFKTSLIRSVGFDETSRVSNESERVGRKTDG